MVGKTLNDFQFFPSQRQHKSLFLPEKARFHLNIFVQALSLFSKREMQAYKLILYSR